MDGVYLPAQGRWLNIGGWCIYLHRAPHTPTCFLPLAASAFYSNETATADFDWDFSGCAPSNTSTGVLLDQVCSGFHPYTIERQADGYRYCLYQNSGALRLRFSVSTDWARCTLEEDFTVSHGIEAFACAGTLFSYAVLPQGGLLLHGVLMEWHGKGIVLSAPSGTGKTTHARLWRDQEQALILNGDRVLCRRTRDGWQAFGSPWCGSSGEYINRHVALSALIFLEQHHTNQLLPLTPNQAALRLLSRAFAPSWEPTLANWALEHCGSLAESVPAFLLQCRPDAASVRTLRQALERL